MPRRPLRPCAEPGCPALSGSSRCPAHVLPSLPSGWRRLRADFLAAHPWCEAPGCHQRATDVDHVVPRSAGGSDDSSNLRALCHACHSRKTAVYDGGLGNARA
jgi:5-methylcytosine-specific restriction protein A